MKVLKKYGPTALVLGITTAGAFAVAPDATTILTAVDSAATTVMGLCITIGTFFAVFKVVKWIRR